jgi:NADH:ubiquinone oxidoreductase subunit 6 (subunit J)
MFDFLDKLRKKPVAEKKMIALTISASITAIIFFVWISSFWIKPSAPESNGKPILSDITPLSSIKDNVAGVYSNFVKLLGVGKSIEVKSE